MRMVLGLLDLEIYQDYKITKGKPKIDGLPSTYVENDDEATTLELRLNGFGK